MTETLKLIEAERQKFKEALEEIGRMSLHEKSGQAVVVARAALAEPDKFYCHLDRPSLFRPSARCKCPGEDTCADREGSPCRLWTKETT